ncbi:alpha-amylase family glycosyl hydrolase [Deinococcus radiophilus]|uniref:alpha-amylase family glycosyl hydrolase n=1 Tax=Deinococcus radiophilus TaxID=32062 RepID=UPI00360B7AB6
MNIPANTYRLQITPDAGLEHAAQTLDYLHQLGVHWVYLSPILRSSESSDHGYDVTDPTGVDPARGGPEASPNSHRRRISAAWVYWWISSPTIRV